MTCPKCGSANTKVVDSRQHVIYDEVEKKCPTCGCPHHTQLEEIEVPVVMRRRECELCGVRWRTFERTDLETYIDREYAKAGIPPGERM